MQQRGIDDAENRGRRSDAQGNRQDGDGAEAWRFAQHAQTVAGVLRQVLEPFPAPRYVTFLLQVRCVAEPATGCGSSITLRHSGLELFVLAQFQMQAHLLFEFRIKLPPMNQHPEPSCKFAQPVHQGAPFRRPRSPA